MLVFAGGDASRPPAFVQAIQLSWRGGAKRPACQWQERPLGRRELSESTETSGGRGSDPPRRLRLRKGEPFFGLQRTVPPQILSFRFFTAPVLCASLGLHLPSSATGGGRFRPPSEKAEWKEEGEKKPACFSDGNGTEEQAGSLFGGRSAYLSRSSRAGRGFFRRPFPPDPEPPPGRPFSGWGAKERTDKAVYAYRRDPPGNPE